MSTIDLDLTEHRSAVRPILTEAHAEVVVATDHATVRWLSGSAIEPGTVGIVTIDAIVLVTADCGQPLARTVAGLLTELQLQTGTVIGVETSALPAALAMPLAGHPLVDVTDSLNELRWRKTPREIEKLERAARYASEAQTILKAEIRNDVTERALSDQVQSTMAQRGRATIAIVDLMFGDRCKLVGAAPTDKRLELGTTALFDFAPVVDDYWGDSCTTTVLGELPDGFEKLHRTTLDALKTGIELLRPGTRAADLDRAVRDVMARGGYEYPHITGHGVGLKQQEQPHIRPDSDVVIEEGMVIALEPGAYFPTFGVRLEHVVHVQADGPQLLTDHELSLSL